MGNSVDVVIPIYKAGNDFVKMLEKLYKQSKRPEHIYLLQTVESKDEKLFDKEKCSHGLANIISVHPIKSLILTTVQQGHMGHLWRKVNMFFL